MSKEYRNNTRAKCSIPVLIHFPDGDPVESMGTIFDLSVGGVKVETTYQMKRGEALFLSYVVAGKYHFKSVKGNIIRVLPEGNKYMIGIKFESEKWKSYLYEAVKSLERNV